MTQLEAEKLLADVAKKFCDDAVQTTNSNSILVGATLTAVLIAIQLGDEGMEMLSKMVAQLSERQVEMIKARTTGS